MMAGRTRLTPYECKECQHLKDGSEFRYGCCICKACMRERRRLQRSNPDYREHERELETARLERLKGRSIQRLGRSYEGICHRCGDAFVYVRSRGPAKRVCGVCLPYRSEWTAYGLTGAQTTELRAQRYCDICKSDDPKRIFPGRKPVFVIDHDHTSGVIRGVLCAACNTGLGLFGEDVVRMATAIQYLIAGGVRRDWDVDV